MRAAHQQPSRLGAGGLWKTLEEPILKENGVNIITHIR